MMVKKGCVAWGYLLGFVVEAGEITARRANGVLDPKKMMEGDVKLPRFTTQGTRSVSARVSLSTRQKVDHLPSTVDGRQ